jgi:hypothetical protein
MREDLVDTAPGHDVAAEKQRHETASHPSTVDIEN